MNGNLFLRGLELQPVLVTNFPLPCSGVESPYLTTKIRQVVFLRWRMRLASKMQAIYKLYIYIFFRLYVYVRESSPN